jgi:hypothetical protein
MISFLQFVTGRLLADPLTLFILTVLFGLLGAVLVAVYRGALAGDRARRNWPSVPGRITSARLSRQAVRTGRLGEETREAYIPQVKFAYTVQGTAYEGRLDTGMNTWMLKGAGERVVKRYPSGATVSVYYDPSAPRNSTLSLSSAGDVLGLSAGIGGCALGLALGVAWIYAIAAPFLNSK